MGVTFITKLLEKRKKVAQFIEEGISRVKKTPVKEYFLPTSKQAVRSATALRDVGRAISTKGFEEITRSDTSLTAPLRRQAFFPVAAAGGLIESAGRGAELLLQPKKTIEQFKKAPAFSLESFSNFEKPSKTSLALETLSPGFDVQDIARISIAGGFLTSLTQGKKFVTKAKDLDVAITEARRMFSTYEDLKPEIQIDVFKRFKQLGEDLFPEVVKAKGVKSLEQSQPNEWLKVVDKFLEDAQAAAREPKQFLADIGLSTKGLKKIEEPLEAGGGKYNISDFDFTDDTKKIFTDTAKQADELIQIERRGKITFEQTRKAAEELFGLTSETLKTKRPGKVLNDAEITKAGDIAKTFFEEELAPLQKGYDEAVKAGKATLQMKAQLLDKMNEGAIIQSKVLGAATELGRGLNARKIIKELLKDPTQLKLDKVIKAFGGEENASKIIERFNQLSLDDPTGRKAYEFLRSLNKPGFMEKANWYWLNMILSGPRTQEKNIISNILMVMLRPADKVFSGIADMGRVGIGKVFGKNVKRERFAGEALAELSSVRKGFVEGLGKFMHIMKNGYSLEDVGKLEVGRVEPVGKVAGAVVGWPLRMLSASDQLFKSIIFNMESNAMAYRKAVQEGTPLLKRAERMVDILKDPSADIIESASNAALKGTFQTAFKEGSLAKRVANLRNWEVKGFKPLKYVIPFIQTPINVMKIGLERGPITGPMKAIWDIATSKGGNRADAMGRMLFSGTALASLGMLAFEGRISGNGPKNKKDADLLKETGWLPNAIRLTNPKNGKDTWISYKGIAPLDQIFSQVASIHERFYLDKEAPTEEKIFGVFTDILKNINNQTFMSGLADWLEALNNPESLSTSKFFSRLGASFVIPNLVRTVAQTQDRVLREADTFIQQVKSGIPIVSKELPAKLDEYDVPIFFEGNALLPTSISSEKLPSYTTREALQIRANVRKANKELEQGKAPSSLDKGRSNFVTAEYVYSNFKNLDSQEEVSQFVGKLKQKGILNKDVALLVDQIEEMDNAGLTKADREMFLYPPGAVRAQLVIDRYKQFSNFNNAESYLATLTEAGLLEDTTGDALRTLNKIRREKREKAGL